MSKGTEQIVHGTGAEGKGDSPTRAHTVEVFTAKTLYLVLGASVLGIIGIALFGRAQ